MTRMGGDDVRATVIPHSDFGDAECCGCLCGIVQGEDAEVVCNECGIVVRRVRAAELDKTLNEMELSLEVASAMCQHCGSVNLVPGFSQILAFVCQNCGRPNAQADC
jgi:hypothetical protein